MVMEQEFCWMNALPFRGAPRGAPKCSGLRWNTRSIDARMHIDSRERGCPNLPHSTLSSKLTVPQWYRRRLEHSKTNGSHSYANVAQNTMRTRHPYHPRRGRRRNGLARIDVNVRSRSTRPVSCWSRGAAQVRCLYTRSVPTRCPRPLTCHCPEVCAFVHD